MFFFRNTLELFLNVRKFHPEQQTSEAHTKSVSFSRGPITMKRRITQSYTVGRTLRNYSHSAVNTVLNVPQRSKTN